MESCECIANNLLNMLETNINMLFNTAANLRMNRNLSSTDEGFINNSDTIINRNLMNNNTNTSLYYGLFIIGLLMLLLILKKQAGKISKIQNKK